MQILSDDTMRVGDFEVVPGVGVGGGGSGAGCGVNCGFMLTRFFPSPHFTTKRERGGEVEIQNIF